jgi:hypothetical protein
MLRARKSDAECGLWLGLCQGTVRTVRRLPLRANDDETPDPREFRLEGAEG